MKLRNLISYNIKLFDEQEVKKINNNAENEILAFTRRCTHAGYEIGAFSGGVSVCSSGHGGRFDTNGKAVSRPATGSLRQYQAVLSGSTLTIS